MTISRPLTMAAAATAGVGLAIGLAAGPAGAAGAKISLTNAVITGVTATASGLSSSNTYGGLTDVAATAALKSDQVIRFGYDTGNTG